MLINASKKSLLRLPRSAKRVMVVFCDIFICGLCVYLAFGLLTDRWLFSQDIYWLVFALAFGFSFPVFIYFGLYRAIFRYIGSSAFLSITHAFIIYTVLFGFIFSLIGVENVPRSIGIIQPILFFMGVGSIRFIIRRLLGGEDNAYRSIHRTQPVALIYGAGSAGRQLASGLAGNKKITIKGFIDDDPSLWKSTVNGIPIFPNVDILHLIRQLNITDVLLAIPSATHDRRSEIISSLYGCGVRVRTLPGVLDIVSGRVRISDLHDLDMNDLLWRPTVPPDMALLERNIQNHVVLVTGAGGSIGSELCRQIIKLSPKTLILIDNSERSLHLIYEELKIALNESNHPNLERANDDQVLSPRLEAPIKLLPYLVSVRDSDSLLKVFKVNRPATVFHAAAFKHVPLVEQNPTEGIRNNVYGTLVCAQAAMECGASQFILVSTDKAVRPTNIMGASKRIAELILQALAENTLTRAHPITFSMVRFGNVLGSSGSVALLFKAQIDGGGPITLTHPEMTRYFMTIPEAAQLVIQAGSMATGGDVFVLDMGQPVRIYDLAVRMIYLSGYLIKDNDHPHGDIEIETSGLRPGEKLYEELLIGDNPLPTSHPKILKAHEEFLSWDELEKELENLEQVLETDNTELIKSILKKLVLGYQPDGDVVSWNAVN